MKFLGDMGVSRSTIEWIRSKGHDAVHLRDQGLQRASDADIMAKALKEGRIVLTFDLDFGAILAASGDKLPSVVIFRLEDESPEIVNRRMGQVLKESARSLEKGATIIVEDERYRVRPLPI